MILNIFDMRMDVGRKSKRLANYYICACHFKKYYPLFPTTNFYRVQRMNRVLPVQGAGGILSNV